MINKSIKIKKSKKILFAISLLCSISLAYISIMIPNISKIYLSINIICFILTIIIDKKIRYDKYFMLFILYYLIILISTIINKSDVNSIIYEFISSIIPFYILFSGEPDEKNEMINSAGNLLFVIGIINLITIIFFPNGLYNQGMERNYYFLGHSNISIRYLLPGVCFTIVSELYKYNRIKIKSIVFILLISLTLILTWPATAIMGFSVFIILMIVLNRFNIFAKIISPLKMFVFSITSSYLIIFSNIQYHFSVLLTKVLHRDLTFTNRTAIWERAIKYISPNPILGLGRTTELYRREVLKATSAHNQFLNILFEGGIVLLIYFIILTIFSSFNVYKCENKKISNTLIAAFAAYMIMWITEPFSYSGTVLMMFIFFIMIYSKEIFKAQREE